MLPVQDLCVAQILVEGHLRRIELDHASEILGRLWIIVRALGEEQAHVGPELRVPRMRPGELLADANRLADPTRLEQIARLQEPRLHLARLQRAIPPDALQRGLEIADL